MPPKAAVPTKGQARTKSATNTNASATSDKAATPLRAVVILDSFTTALNPLSSNTLPRCLMPLVGTPIIEYTLEFLVHNGVEEVFVYAAGGGSAHADAIEAYLGNASSRWGQEWPLSPFKSFVLLKIPTACSMGDCMRDLDDRDLMGGDFLVVSGDVVSNIDIAPALKQHRARRLKDKNAIMTMVLTEAEPASGITRLRTKDQKVQRGQRKLQPIFVLDPTHARCLHYEDIENTGSQRICLDQDVLESSTTIDVRSDLSDPYIDIYTPDVLALWNDNFDSTSPRASFLFGILKDYELNGKTVHTYIAHGSEYAGRVRDLVAYDKIAWDILAKRVAPLAPDKNLLADQTFRIRQGGRMFVEEGRDETPEEEVTVRRNVELNGYIVIGGKGTSIGKGSCIFNTIIGRGCRIGENVNIINAHIWDNVTIGDDAKIEGPAILTSDVSIGKKTTVCAGSILGNGLNVADDETFTMTLSANRPATGGDDTLDFDSDESSNEDYVPLINHQAGVRHKVARQDRRLFSHRRIGSQSSISTLASSSSSVPAMSEVEGSSDNKALLISSDPIDPHSSTNRASFQNHRRNSSVTSTTSSGTLLNLNKDENDFHQEAYSSILDGLNKSDHPDTIFLELNGYRMSVDASQNAVRRAVATAFVAHISQSIALKGDSINAAVAVSLKKYTPLLERIILDKDNHKFKPDQVHFLTCLQRECALKISKESTDQTEKEEKIAQQILLFMVKELYDLEIVEEDGVLQWWGQGDVEGNGGVKSRTGRMDKARVLVQVFVKFLEEAEEEEEEGEEEEEEEEEDDEEDDEGESE